MWEWILLFRMIGFIIQYYLECHYKFRSIDSISKVPIYVRTDNVENSMSVFINIFMESDDSYYIYAGIPGLSRRGIYLIVKNTARLSNYEEAILYHERCHALQRHSEKHDFLIITTIILLFSFPSYTIPFIQGIFFQFGISLSETMTFLVLALFVKTLSYSYKFHCEKEADRYMLDHASDQELEDIYLHFVEILRYDFRSKIVMLMDPHQSFTRRINGIRKELILRGISVKHEISFIDTNNRIFHLPNISY